MILRKENISTFDIMMPNMDGYELTKSLRDAKYNLPVLVVTAKEQFDDMQKGFGAGADDYMIKPVNVRELVLRVEALLRRAKISSEKKITVGRATLDYDALTVTLHGEETILLQKEFYLLYKLLGIVVALFVGRLIIRPIKNISNAFDDYKI